MSAVAIQTLSRIRLSGDPLQLYRADHLSQDRHFPGHLVSLAFIAMNRESRLQHWPETQLCIRKPEKINQ